MIETAKAYSKASTFEETSPPNGRFRNLGHTFAQIALHRVVDLDTHEALRQAPVETTLDIYTHVILGMRKSALSALDRLFG